MILHVLKALRDLIEHKLRILRIVVSVEHQDLSPKP